MESHEQCNLNQQPEYPTRLLSISNDSTRLVSTTGWTIRPQYATLSHCWGSLKFETLRSDNFKEVHTSIPGNLLTKTFADAIAITRGVGLQYIWIDSWCIIQDSHEDWEVESGRMSSVHGGSSLNIAASSSTDGTGGCCIQPTDHSGGFEAEVCIGGRKQRHHFLPLNMYERSIHKNPLAMRAWALQEKALSPRTLHCLDQGIFWECRTTMASEDFPDGLDGSYAHNSFVKESPLLHLDPTNSFSWTSLVNRYSGCNLTYPRDKLVALSGIACFLRDKNQDEYFAGLFRKDLEINLCWIMQFTVDRPTYRAPSWSWAAVDGRVSYLPVTSTTDRNFYIQVHDVSVDNKGIDSCGEVTRGCLTLDCDVILKATLKGPQRSSRIRHVCFDGTEEPLYGDSGHEDILFPFRLDSREKQDERLGQAVCVVPILSGACSDYTHPQVDNAVSKTRIIFGVIIKKVDGPQDEYERIGSFEYNSCD